MEEVVEAEDRDLEIVDGQDPDPTNVVQGALPATVPWSAGGPQAMTTSGQALVTADDHPEITHDLAMETGMDLVVARKSLDLVQDHKLDLAQDLAGFSELTIRYLTAFCVWAKNLPKNLILQML